MSKAKKLAEHERRELRKKIQERRVAKAQNIKGKAKATLSKVEQEIRSLKDQLSSTKKWAEQAEAMFEAWAKALQTTKA